MSELATVLTLSRKGATVDLDEGGEVLEADVRGRLHHAARRETGPVAVGDRVRVERDPDAPGRVSIVSVEPRRSVLLRPEVAGRWRHQVLVANADVAFLVFAHRDPVPSPGLVDRLLVACHAGEVHPVLVFNKADLEPAPETASLVRVYESLGYEVLRASAESGDGVAALRTRLRGRCSVFAGPSGAGKSSLVNRALPGVRLRTGEISRLTGKGTHTTTAAQLVRLPVEPDEAGGAEPGMTVPRLRPGHVIDTPGIKEFGLIGIEPRELDLHFPEFPGPGLCDFRDCSHRGEPRCAVRDAVEAGTVARSRYESYGVFLAEVAADARRESEGGTARDGARGSGTGGGPGAGRGAGRRAGRRQRPG